MNFIISLLNAICPNIIESTRQKFESQKIGIKKLTFAEKLPQWITYQ